jgi:hypothetical protein
MFKSSVGGDLTGEAKPKSWSAPRIGADCQRICGLEALYRAPLHRSSLKIVTSDTAYSTDTFFFKFACPVACCMPLAIV